MVQDQDPPERNTDFERNKLEDAPRVFFFDSLAKVQGLTFALDRELHLDPCRKLLRKKVAQGLREEKEGQSGRR